MCFTRACLTYGLSFTQADQHSYRCLPFVSKASSSPSAGSPNCTHTPQQVRCAQRPCFCALPFVRRLIKPSARTITLARYGPKSYAFPFSFKPRVLCKCFCRIAGYKGPVSDSLVFPAGSSSCTQGLSTLYFTWALFPNAILLLRRVTTSA